MFKERGDIVMTLRMAKSKNSFSSSLTFEFPGMWTSTAQSKGYLPILLGVLI